MATKEKKDKKPKNDNHIKLTNAKPRLIMMSDAYAKLTTPIDPRKISGKAKIKIMRLSMRLDPVLEAIEKIRDEYLDMFAKKDKEGHFILKPPQQIIEAYTKRDEEGNPIKDKKTGKPIVELPEDLPKTGWLFEFKTKKDEETFNEKLREVLKEDAEIPGERITISDKDIPEELNSDEMKLLNPLINFEEAKHS